MSVQRSGATMTAITRVKVTKARLARPSLSTSRIVALCGLVLACGGLAPTDASACTCIGPFPPCQAVWQSPLVFRGRVVAIEPTTAEERASARNSPTMTSDGLRVTFEVSETLHGALPASSTGTPSDTPTSAVSSSSASRRVAIVTSGSSSSCGYEFEKAEEYIVYAHRATEGAPLSTGLCSRTRPVSEAADDLRYLRAVRDNPDSLRGRIFGRVSAFDRSFAAPSGPPPALVLPPDIRLVLQPESGGATRETPLSGDGAFEFADLPAGAYRLDLRAPDTLTGWKPSRLINLSTPQACAELGFNLSHNGRLAGRLVDPTGAPAVGLTIGATSVAALNERWYHVEETTTASDGTFEVKRLPPDRYVLGLNLTPSYPARNGQSGSADPRLFFTTGVMAGDAVSTGRADGPSNAGRTSRLGGTSAASGDARVFTVDAGARVRVGDFTVPASLNLVSITGIVIDMEGRPLANAEVGLYGTDPAVRRRSGPTRTDAEGRFTLAAIAGQRYRLSAQHRVEAATTYTVQTGQSAEFVAAAALPPFRVACESRTFPRPY